MRPRTAHPRTSDDPMEPSGPDNGAEKGAAAASLVFDAFISYRRSDGTKAAQRLRRKLQRYDIRKRLPHLGSRKLNVFLDTVYERGADDFYQRNIRPALLSSRWLIVLATPDAVLRAASDDWIQREIEEFRAHRGAENILVVRAAGDFLSTLPGDLDATAPHIQVIDLRHDGFWSALSPLRFSRLADEWIKLVAPLFDIEPGDMPKLRREQELAQQRLLATAAGGVAGAVAFAAVFSWYALTQQRASQQTLDNSLFAVSRVIETASGLDLDSAHQGEKRSMLMTACDLFDNLADRAAQDKFELEVLHCDLDRISALIDLKERERAQNYFQAIDARARTRYAAYLAEREGAGTRPRAMPSEGAERSDRAVAESRDRERHAERQMLAWAQARSSLLDLAIRIEQLSVKDDPEMVRVVLRNSQELGELFKTHLAYGLAVSYGRRVWWLLDAMEKAGNFMGAAEASATAAALFEAMARKERDLENETEEAAQRRQIYGISEAATLLRRLGWLRTEKLGDHDGALDATARAFGLIRTGLGLAPEDTGQHIALRREEMLAEEVRGTALLGLKRLADAAMADQRGRSIAVELLALELNDDQREEFERERRFLDRRMAGVAAQLASGK